MKKVGADLVRRTIELLLLAAIILSTVFLAAQFMIFQNEQGSGQSAARERSRNILVLGKSDRKAYLEQVFLGAQSRSKANDAAVDLYTGTSATQEISTQALLNYASYLQADGIIVYIESSDSKLDIPLNKQGKPIPMVTIGAYRPDLPQLSYIGANYSELGKITGREIIGQIGQSGKAILLESSGQNDANHSNLMAGLLGTLATHPEISIKTLQFEKESSFSKEDNLRQQLASEEGLELIVSLTEENTILAAQSVRDLNLSGKVKIIGFGDSDDCRSDFEKKIVTELISVKIQDIGRRAMTEIFEYLENGYANSFVSAEVEILKGGGE
ncbi:MAG: substrate-binding domain-containing protein [Treponema sp.]|nr:substrate-binding domain-containing protein [Treponema sp.]MEE3436322.1 substrate-binding domain-containing protein [Treponema sp.]